MAITIHQQPAKHSAIGSKTVFVAGSTNSGNENFRYVVQYYLPNGLFFDVNIAPNPNGYLVFEPNAIFESFCLLSNQSDYSNRSIHANANGEISTYEVATLPSIVSGFVNTNMFLKEGWDVDGVFTIDEGSSVDISIFYYGANLSLQAGVNYDYLQRIGYQDGLQSRIMSDRDFDTHKWDKAATFGLTSNCIYIPTYESDWGCFTLRGLTDGVEATKIRLAILPQSGPPQQMVLSLIPENPTGAFEHVFVCPANLNDSPISGILKPQDYPNWKAIYFQVLNNDEEIISASYVMYNAEVYANDGVGCLGVYDKIRLAWVGRSGGWEYHNFTKKSEESFVMETTTAQRVIGNHGTVNIEGGTLFSFNQFDESEIVVDKKVDRFMTANSDWLTDGEFQWMKGLFLSKKVHWVQDDGTHIPVIVEGDGYTVKRKFGGGQLFDQQVKFRIAQPYFN